MDDGAAVVAAGVHVLDQQVHQRYTAAATTRPGGCSPATLVGDGDEDVVSGAVRFKPHRSRSVGVIGIGVFNGVGDRFINRQDEVPSDVGREVEDQPVVKLAAQHGGVACGRNYFGPQRGPDIRSWLPGPAWILIIIAAVIHCASDTRIDSQLNMP